MGDNLESKPKGSEVNRGDLSWKAWLLQRHRDPLDNETSAWIWFDVANSCFATVSLATFLPLVLNSYATTYAWASAGGAKPPACSDLATAYSQPCIECRIGEGDLLCTGSGTGRENCGTLNTPLLPGGINPTSFAFFIISLSCLSQLVSFMLFAETGDHSQQREWLLLLTSLIGSGSLIIFAFFPEGEGSAKYVLAALVTIVSNTAFGMAQVYYNAYLPLIAEDQAKITPDEDQDYIENKLSSYALAGGYWAGVIGLILSIGLLAATGGLSEGATEYEVSSSFRWAIVLSGVWWFIGTLLTVPRFQSRPGPPKPFTWLGSVKKFGATISTTYQQLPITFYYLIAYFLYSDGYSTISGLGLLYARLDMCAPTSTLFVIALEAPFCAALGNFLFLWLSRTYQISNRHMVVLILFILTFLPIWGLLGYVSDSIGFRNSWEAYLLGAYFGFCLGAIQNFSRTLFIEVIPKSCENEYFAFYELTDKGSSWLGPMVVGALASSGSNLRISFLYIIVMTLMPAIWLCYLDVEGKGHSDIEKYESLLQSNNTEQNAEEEVELVAA